MKPNIDSIFCISSADEFQKAAIDIFRFQAKENEIYHRFITSLKIKTEQVNTVQQIPFLPIEFFKNHTVVSEKNNVNAHTTVFSSSGTTGMNQSKHFVTDVSVYEKSYLKAFEQFYGNIEDYCILALLPSYLERQGSSLIHMAADLIEKSKHPESGFYLSNYDELISKLNQLEEQKQKTLLIGVTYALLDLIEKNRFKLNHTFVMETGGMKGKRREMVREELHQMLCNGFGVSVIHSEYGMTELLSQAYSNGNGIFYCPPWMRVMIRDTNDPFAYLPINKTGGINVIDLANINSCSFIATQDLGRLYANDSFEVLGRFDNSDIRGCNLMIE